MSLSRLEDARLLIVDDQESNIAMLEALLEEAGYHSIEGVTDPREAADAFARVGPDLVLLDLVMPHLDGFGVLVQIRPLIAPESFLPVLVLTADIAPEAKRRALAQGATDFLVKPLDTVEVLLRIRNLLQTRALHQQLQGQNARLEEQVQARTEALQARTRELEEARAQVLELYRELAKRNQELHDLVDRLLRAREQTSPAPARPETSALVERLTPREREVLRLVAQGQTNGEIAERLVVSAATVKFHVEHIIGKLGVADRTQAAVRAVELGLLADA
jgi:DNA-binding NarL/FixJ family response regulator